MTSKTVGTIQTPNATAFASLRLFGDALVPEEIGRLLGTQPAESAPKGHVTVSASGKRRTAPTGRWVLSTEGQVSATDLAEHVSWLLDRLEAAGAMPLDLPGVTRADVVCFWEPAPSQVGLELPPDVLARLARHRLPLGIEVYS